MMFCHYTYRIEHKHDFPFIEIYEDLREVLKTESEADSYVH